MCLSVCVACSLFVYSAFLCICIFRIYLTHFLFFHFLMHESIFSIFVSLHKSMLILIHSVLHYHLVVPSDIIVHLFHVFHDCVSILSYTFHIGFVV